MKRHIASKHYSGIPILNPGFETIKRFRKFSESAETSAAKAKIRSETFAENYQFTLSEGQTKNMIMADIMERVKNLNPTAFLSPPQGGSFLPLSSFSKIIFNGNHKQTPSYRDEKKRTR